MKIYLMRHGEAESAGKDKDRRLSQAGKNDVTKLAAFLHPLNLTVDHFFHSDKMRAIETATIIATAIYSRSPMLMRKELDSMSSIHELLDELPTLSGDILLVGHMPYMGKLASFLTAAHENVANYAIEPGCIICFEAGGFRSNWQLAWMINPRQLLSKI